MHLCDVIKVYIKFQYSLLVTCPMKSVTLTPTSRQKKAITYYRSKPPNIVCILLVYVTDPHSLLNFCAEFRKRYRDIISFYIGNQQRTSSPTGKKYISS